RGGPRPTNPNPSAGKRKKKKKRRRRSGSAPNITDINRFVIDTCKRLKERKSYLVWNAIGCLGVSAFSDLVKEVDAIQRCGGQKTADESRFRTGGGILWNILKTREPKAYKEIMAKGREFEKQLLQPKKRQKTNTNEEAVSPNTSAPDQATEEEVFNGSERISEVQSAPELPDSIKGRVSVHDRVRVPVSYDDLFEEGEIHE
ncbi:uncharacterized protein LOC109842434, partial [Asparagus officinalis]|uniref:uncharacterized protein LOC109842434 n=1 Tax=Asparagus officinalis TaxID=4686 RepID=UPI00098E52FF